MFMELKTLGEAIYELNIRCSEGIGIRELSDLAGKVNDAYSDYRISMTENKDSKVSFADVIGFLKERRDMNNDDVIRVVKGKENTLREWHAINECMELLEAWFG